MTKIEPVAITTYECPSCHKKYKSKKQAQQCINKHSKFDKIPTLTVKLWQEFQQKARNKNILFLTGEEEYENYYLEPDFVLDLLDSSPIGILKSSGKTEKAEGPYYLYLEIWWNRKDKEKEIEEFIDKELSIYEVDFRKYKTTKTLSGY